MSSLLVNYMADEADESAAEKPQPEKRPVTRSSRRWGSWIAAGLLLVGLAVLIAPTLLGSSWVVNPLLARFLKDDLRAEVAGVKLGWFRPLEISQLTIQEPSGELLIDVASIRGQRSLLGLLWDRQQWGEVRVIRPTVNLSQLDEGTNFRKLVSALRPAKQEPPAAREPLRADVEVRIEDLRVVIRDQQQVRPLLDVPWEDFAVRYAASTSEPLVSVPPTELFRRAKLTPELFAFGLKYVIPVAAEAAAIDGEVSLAVGDIRLPLDSLLDSAGSGRLTVHAVSLQARSPLMKQISEVLGKLLRSEGAGRVVLVADSEIEFALADRRVHHAGLKFGLPAIDPDLVFETSGTVGFDQSLDLILTVPISSRLLERASGFLAALNPEVTSQVGDAIEDAVGEQASSAALSTAKFQGLRIPIRGTLSEPQILWQETLGPQGNAVAEALGDGLWLDMAKQVGGQLGQRLLEKRRQRGEPAEPDLAEPNLETSDGSAAEAAGAEEPVREGPLRRLRNRLRRGNQSRQGDGGSGG
ncbi:hypothetical protein SH139x_004462 [Planctomycetaceae bacterium SH139]